MKTMSIGEFKSHFSSVLERARAGKETIIEYGKKKEKVAVLVPFRAYCGGKAKARRKLGLLSSRGRPVFSDNFSMTDEELLSS